jgi:two-component sensor histidine kinase
MPPIHPTAANDLALALIACSTAPLVLLDGDLFVVSVSDSFCSAFQIDKQNAVGRAFSDLGQGEWKIPQVNSLLRATVDGYAAVDAYELELKRQGRETRCLVLNARKLIYSTTSDSRLLLTVSDITDARIAERLKDDMVRERGILLQELRHRVANSLQIIAGVLMQSALKVKSEETRSHLYEVHNRVMSVAAIQEHLSPPTEGEVALGGYFKALCDSIGASMIRDHNQITLDTTSDDSVTGADVSVSLGLILTELVINALKHAFPDGRKGRINVDYRSKGPAWTLSVSDDGVGMPSGTDEATPGLGTSIISAIASQLGGKVRVTATNPGTSVSVSGDGSRVHVAAL